MNKWMYERMIRIIELMNEWNIWKIIERKEGWMDGWMYECENQLMNGRMDRWDELMEKWIYIYRMIEKNERMNGRMDGYIIWSNGWETLARKNGWGDYWMNQ